MSEPPILLSREGHVALLTLNRPDRRNALDAEAKRLLAKVWAEIGDDPAIRAVVLTGAGEKAFCVGADLREVAAGDRGAAPRPQYPPAIYSARQAGVFKPVVTAINGVCAGGGLHFVADGDLVIAAERATFFDPHVDVGQVAALEPIGLARRAPLGAVLRMVLLGRSERLSAQRALQLGLVSEVVADDRLRSRALELATTIAAASPAAVQASLRAIWESLDRGLEDGLRHGWDLLAAHWDHPDASEGPRAFAEQREPRWSED